MEIKQWFEYTNEERMAIEDNKERYVDSYLKTINKIDDINARLNSEHFDLLYKYPETKRKSLTKKLNKLKEDKQWLEERIEECDKHIKIYKMGV